MKLKLLTLFAVLSTTFSFGQFSGNALDFDGTNDMVVINTVPAYFSTLSTSDFTIEAWVNPRGSAFQRIFFAQPSTTNFVSIGPSTGNVIYFYVIVNGTTHSVATTTSITQNQWTHIAGRWTASTSTVEVLFNGVVQPTVAGGGSSTGTSGLMTLGTRPGGAQYFNGGMDEVRLWNEARTDCEIIANMNHHITGAESNLTFNFDFNQGVGGGTNTGVTTLPDLTGNSYNGTLTNFALTGATSNWITSAANISTSASTQNSGGPAITSEPTTVILCSNGNASYAVTSGATSFQWQENNGSGWANLSNTLPYSGVTTNSLAITGATGTMSGYRYRCMVATGTCNATSDSAFLYVSNISSTIASQTDVTCNGGSSGAASINTPTGGVGTYTYDWTGNPTGDGTTSVTGLTAGPWSCMITDSVGCSSTQTFSITEPTALLAGSTSTSILCNGGNATVTVSASGGISPYTGTGTFIETVGTYTYTITDMNGCVATTTITLTEPAVLAASITTATGPTTCGGNDGAIDITVTGGTSGYSYLWNNSATSEDISSLIAGSYSCTITDANGCTTSVSTSINDPAPPTVTFNCSIDTACQTTQVPFTITGESPAGGTFSGPGVSSNTFDPMLANIGTNLITYTYTNSNGCTASAVDSIYVDLCMGINQNTKDNFSISPNPNNGMFYLTLNTQESANIAIYNELGQIIETQQVQGQTPIQFNIKNSGIYLITITTSNGQRTSKRIVVNQ